ncbi:hypothetical protein LHGZ1_1509 [Laribacter hongkongensis]|uniref:Uncharacterized protein n=1 Tax=Laribacter hongkongensis TaxID=168471 RepID=A0A248LHS8_9NEIS|nr:hypothetical protein LHGZ1_1509 [Laribacter hongkongensis]
MNNQRRHPLPRRPSQRLSKNRGVARESVKIYSRKLVQCAIKQVLLEPLFWETRMIGLPVLHRGKKFCTSTH